jgi:hypothetical protein
VKYFYDTEFHEDGKTIDFISIGVVAEDGREFYRVSKDFDTRRVAQNEWLMENVMTSIDHEQFIVHDFEGKPAIRDLYVTDAAAAAKDVIAGDLYDFVKGDATKIEFWAWFSAYDHVCLAQLFGKMIDLPKKVPMYTNDIRTLVDLAKVRPNALPRQPDGHHNALADARQNVVRYNYLRNLL